MGLSDWLLKWQMKVSFDKYKMMHTGKNTANFTYKIMGYLTNCHSGKRSESYNKWHLVL